MMNTKLLIAFCFLIPCISMAKITKEIKVPNEVQDAFQSQYKEVKNVKWEIEKDGNYEAEFLVNKIEMSATYTAAGKLVETEVEIAKNYLPEAVSDYVAKYYASYKISEASKITDER